LASPKMSSKLIERLNEAEIKAESIIDEAKKYRKTILAKARDAAEEELKGFSSDQDRVLREALAGQGDDDATKALESTTAGELAAVEGDFQRNSAKTVEFVVSKVLDVPLTLTSTQRQALISDASKPAAAAPKPAAPKPAAPKPAAPAPAPAPAAPAPAAPAPPPQRETPPAPEPKQESFFQKLEEKVEDAVEEVEAVVEAEVEAVEPTPAPAAVPAQSFKPETKKKNKGKKNQGGE